ncbi:MAG: MG2 domain-containing protein [Flavitalea sp.]
MKKYLFIIACLFSFNAFAQKILKEKFYVATDKPVYLAGETIYLKAFCTDNETGKPLDLSRVAYIEIVREKQPYARAIIELKNGSGNGYLDLPSSLGSGTYTLRMYTNWMKNFGPESFYHRNLQIINPLSKENPKLQVTALPALKTSEEIKLPELKVGSLFDRRSKVSVAIDMYGNGNENEGYDLYATVYFMDKTGISEKESNGKPGLELLAPGKKENGLNEKLEIKYLPETKGHIVRAVANENISGKDVFLSVPGRPAKLYTGIPDSTGGVTFLTDLIPGGEVVVPQIYYEGSHNGNITVLSPFSEEYIEDDLPEKRNDQTEVGGTEMNIQKSLLSQQVAYYFGQEEQVVSPVLADTSMFFPKTEYTYLLDDYTRFPTMEEVLREYVVGVIVQKNKNGYRFESVSRDKFGIATVHHPVVLIDGIPVSANTAIKLDPLKVSRLDILTQSYYYGTAVFDGIISFHTYDGKLGELNLDPGVIPVEYPGVQLSRLPLFPEYNTAQKKSSRLPDFRTTLYWNPSISKGRDGNYAFDFSTSDMKGKYMIVVEGMSKEGKSIRLEKEVMVN